MLVKRTLFKNNTAHKVVYGLNREMGISLAEIWRHLGAGESAIAMAIRKEERSK
jgi:hypothetical protein